jgi:hypothetical protein
LFEPDTLSCRDLYRATTYTYDNSGNLWLRFYNEHVGLQEPPDIVGNGTATTTGYDRRAEVFKKLEAPPRHIRICITTSPGDNHEASFRDSD